MLIDWLSRVSQFIGREETSGSFPGAFLVAFLGSSQFQESPPLLGFLKLWGLSECLIVPERQPPGEAF